jgi:hypothetical protein
VYERTIRLLNTRWTEGTVNVACKQKTDEQRTLDATSHVGGGLRRRRDASEPERHAEWDDLMIVQNG